AAGSSIAWCGGNNYHWLGNPRGTQEWYTSELAKPRTSRSAIRVALLHRGLVDACIEMGELSKARAYLAEDDAPRKPPQLLFFEGEWELADKRLTARSESARTSGDRWGDFWFVVRLARLRRFTGDAAQAVQFLEGALEISHGGDILFELVAK